MRIRAAATAAVLALALLAGCGDDDDPSVPTGDDPSVDVEEESTDDEATVDGEEQPDGDDTDAAAAIDAAQLEASDLGPGWELTSTTPPDTDPSDDEPTPLDDCLATDLQDAFDAGKVAETEERTFELADGDSPLPSQVTASSVALDDADLFDQMHDVLRDEEFGQCISDGFRTLMAEQTGGQGEVTIGDIEATEGTVEVDDAESTRLGFAMTITSQGFTFETTFGITFVNVGSLGSSLLAFGPDGGVTPEQEAEWASLLAERLAGS